MFKNMSFGRQSGNSCSFFAIFFSFLCLSLGHTNDAIAGNTCAGLDSVTSQKYLQSLSQKCQNDSLIAKLTSSGFSCQNYECKGKINGYPEPIIIMIPKNWDPKAGFHFHFHGHNLTGDADREKTHFNKKTGDGDYLNFANQAGLKSLMIFPLSQGKCQTFNSEIKNFESLNKISESLNQLTDANPNRWSLSFHSGADSTANRLLKDPLIDKKLTGVALFDSLYAERTGIKEGFARLSEKNPPVPTLSFFVPNTSTEKYNQWLKKDLSKSEFIAAKGSSHMGIMKYGMTDFFKKVQIQ